jgi:hypothetical protein
VTPFEVEHRPLPSAVVRGSLEHGLLFLLGLLDHDRENFEFAAVAWHARWCQNAPEVGFETARAVLDALEMLTGPDPASAAKSLRAECSECRLDEVIAVLDDWLDRYPATASGTERSQAR